MINKTTRVEDLSTPAMVIDDAVVEQNLRRMSAYSREHGLNFRPHSKTHKSIQMGLRQVAGGTVGLTVAKAGEAEVMANACDDLLLGYPALDPHRAARLAQLARSKTVRVAVDSIVAAEVLSQAARDKGSTIGLLVELDVGFHRTGLQDAESAVVLARRIAALPAVRFDGLFFFPGHILWPAKEQAPAMRLISQKLAKVLDLLTRDGLAAPIVSGGSTPTAFQSHLIPQLTEIRPGTYIYNDWCCAAGGWSALEDCAARVICTVVSDAVPGKVVIDAGSKTLTSDRLVTDPANGGFGYVMEYPEARIVRLSEEHGELDLSRCDRRPRLGEKVSVLPNHICPCVNLQEQVWLKHADGSLTSLVIDARQKLA